MNSMHTFLIIVVAALVTMALRFLPFVIFKGRQTPAYIAYLGRVLPYAIMGMLVVYCLKGITFVTIGGWVPAALGVAAVVLLHLWKRNSLISILGGTILYMILVQL